MSAISTIKDAIKTQLDALVTAGTLSFASELDIRTDPLAGDIPSFPAAYLMPPSTESDVVDNRTVMRVFNFAIMIVQKAENIASATEIETLIENILNRFDNVPTLSGAADGAVEPASTVPEPYQQNNKNLIVFFITLKVHRTFTLTY